MKSLQFASIHVYTTYEDAQELGPLPYAGNVVDKSWRRRLGEKKIGKSVEEKCWRRVLQRSVEKKFCRELLEKSVVDTAATMVKQKPMQSSSSSVSFTTRPDMKIE